MQEYQFLVVDSLTLYSLLTLYESYYDEHGELRKHKELDPLDAMRLHAIMNPSFKELRNNMSFRRKTLEFLERDFRCVFLAEILSGYSWVGRLTPSYKKQKKKLEKEIKKRDEAYKKYEMMRKLCCSSDNLNYTITPTPIEF